MVWFDECKLGKACHKQEDNQGVGEADKESSHTVVHQGATAISTLMDFLRRVRFITINTEHQQHDTATQFEIKHRLQVVDNVHHETHSESCYQCIYDITDGSAVIVSGLRNYVLSVQI